MTAKTYISIEGETLDPSKLQLPTSRENRNAWTRNGDVIEVDPAKVQRIKEERATEIERSVMDDTGTLRAIAEVIAEVAFRVSQGNIPQNLTEEQAVTFVRNRLRAKVRANLGLD